MAIDAKNYRLADAQANQEWLNAMQRILYPLGLPPHLSDEDVAAQLDKEEKYKARARKSAETRRRKKEAITHD